MADTETRELKVREKKEVATPAEQTRPGLVFTPAVDIYESDKEITLLADLPGVKADDLTIDLRDNTLTLSADVVPAGGDQEEPLLTEYEVGKFYRQFTLGEIVDQNKIEASLNDGVLRLTLPKVAAATPRKIAVKSV